MQEPLAHAGKASSLLLLFLGLFTQAEISLFMSHLASLGYAIVSRCAPLGP